MNKNLIAAAAVAALALAGCSGAPDVVEKEAKTEQSAPPIERAELPDPTPTPTREGNGSLTQNERYIAATFFAAMESLPVYEQDALCHDFHRGSDSLWVTMNEPGSLIAQESGWSYSLWEAMMSVHCMDLGYPERR